MVVTIRRLKCLHPGRLHGGGATGGCDSCFSLSLFGLLHASGFGLFQTRKIGARNRFFLAIASCAPSLSCFGVRRPTTSRCLFLVIVSGSTRPCAVIATTRSTRRLFASWCSCSRCSFIVSSGQNFLPVQDLQTQKSKCGSIDRARREESDAGNLV